MEYICGDRRTAKRGLLDGEELQGFLDLGCRVLDLFCFQSLGLKA